MGLKFLGLSYENEGNYQTASYHYEKLLKFLEKTNNNLDNISYLRALNKIANIYFLQCKYEKSF